MTLAEKLESIRTCIDADVTGCDIETILEKGEQLSQLIGLSAECKAAAKRNLELARAKAIMGMPTVKSPLLILKLADAKCADEIADFEYADRLNAGITHQLDFYRSVISLHKCEIENNLKQM